MSDSKYDKEFIASTVVAEYTISPPNSLNKTITKRELDERVWKAMDSSRNNELPNIELVQDVLDIMGNIANADERHQFWCDMNTFVYTQLKDANRIIRNVGN